MSARQENNETRDFLAGLRMSSMLDWVSRVVFPFGSPVETLKAVRHS